MSTLDDICSAAFKKEFRMFWARQFIKAWLSDPQMQFISKSSVDSLTSLANNWIKQSVDYNQACPIVSSEDIREAGEQILALDELNLDKDPVE